VHLLLLDMQMPRLTGLETIERLREQSFPWQHAAGSPIIALPWILISGALDEQIIARARAACVFSVLPKPLRLPELTGAVTQALAHAYNWRAA
jgi:CheY-like chemotaxis protein